jgi:hypothetical protein
MKHAYEIMLSFQSKNETSAERVLTEMFEFVDQLKTLSPNLDLDKWLLGGETKDEAQVYKVFDSGNPAEAVTAILEKEFKDVADPRMVTIWNGLDGREGASLRYMGRPEPHTSLVTFNGRPQSFSSDWKAVGNAVAAAALIWKPKFATLESNDYFDRKVFKDRPGAGWMIYLPEVLSESQVPEARALVPVMAEGDGKKKKSVQLGTIVVSVTDEAFSDQNPEHVKIANAIEIRLADQDLLPRYSDL